MSRRARFVLAGVPHHVTQRGNRRGQVFFSDGDRLVYLHWLCEYAIEHGLEVLAYCLMTNHVHLVVVPQTAEALPIVLRNLHARIAKRVNRTNEWNGHLWQSRYFASALDESHFWAAIRYVERNPVRAGMVARAEDYPWSSARAHCGLATDAALTANHRRVDDFRGMGDWSAWLAAGDDSEALNQLRDCAQQGLPCGSESFIEQLETSTGLKLTRHRRGRPAKRK